MPFTQKEEVAVLSFVEVCSLELAEALKSDQKVEESLPALAYCPGQSVPCNSGAKLYTKSLSKLRVLLSCKRARRALEGAASVFK